MNTEEEKTVTDNTLPVAVDMPADIGQLLADNTITFEDTRIASAIMHALGDRYSVCMVPVLNKGEIHGVGLTLSAAEYYILRLASEDHQKVIKDLASRLDEFREEIAEDLELVKWLNRLEVW